jgi:hypothetical protein
VRQSATTFFPLIPFLNLFLSGFGLNQYTEIIAVKVISDCHIAPYSGYFSVLALLQLSAAFDTDHHFF